MTINKKISLTIAGLAAGLLTAGTVMAHGGGPGGRGMRGGDMMSGKVMRLLNSLDLSEEQEVQAVRVRRAIRENREASRAAVKQQKMAIAGELKNDQPNSANIHKALDAIIDRKRTDAHFAVDKLMELHGTLNAEQRAELVDKIDRFQKRRSERKERGRRGIGK